MTLATAALTAIAWVAWSAPDPGAGSQTKSPTVALAPISIRGSLAEGWTHSLQQSLNEGLHRGGRGLRITEIRGHQMPSKRCVDRDCWASVANSAAVDFVVVPRITVEDRDFHVELELRDHSGARVATSSETCEVCAVLEVAHMLAGLASVLNTKLYALGRKPPSITFESRPPNARIYLDGELVGQAPVTRDVAPGKHRARAELRGRIPLELFIEPVAGTRETVEFQLDAAPRGQRTRPYGWAALAVGIASTATGVALLVLDERPYRERCDGAYLDAEGNCRFRYDTLAAGIGVTAVGAASLIAGAVILGVSARRTQARRVTARPLLAPRSRAAGLVLQGRM